MSKCEELNDSIIFDKYLIKNALSLEKVRRKILNLYPQSILFETRDGFQEIDGNKTMFMVDLLFEATLVNNEWKVFGKDKFELKVDGCKKIFNERNKNIWDKLRNLKEFLHIPEGFPIALVLGFSAARFIEYIPNIKIDKNEPEVVFRVYKKIIKYNANNQNVEIDLLKNNSEDKSDINDILKILTEENSYTKKNENLKLGCIKDLTNKEEYCKWVEKAKEYIHRGDIYQVQICRHAVSNAEIKPVDLYEKLTTINPAPYMYYIELKNQHVISSSPELMIRCENGISQCRPIAGTMSKEDIRGSSLDEIPKEMAEHLMLVDLARNDLSRCAVKGGIEVSSFMKLESYGVLNHLVSTVETQIRKECDIFDLLKANFPAGTMTGAPKVRAMEIISELEGKARGLFSGCAGYITGKNDGVFALTIRTIVGNPGSYMFRAAAGIVADSKAVCEWDEAGAKIRAFARAIGGNI